ncbi:MAG: SPOR domain-containing protein [Pseudomonadota bacterium]
MHSNSQHLKSKNIRSNTILDTFARGLLTFAVTAVLYGCSSAATQTTTVYESEGDEAAGGAWFCEMGESTEDWKCVRNEALARNPQPSRLPDPAPASTPTGRLEATQSDNVTDDPSGSYTAASRSDTSYKEPQRELPNAPQQAQPQPAPTKPTPDLSNLPKHVRLSYRPSKPVSLLDLPEDFWVVQLVSVSSKETLERYAVENQLRGMSAARVWSQNQFFYVLILGIYETYDNAKAASEGLPPPFDEFPPWIRSVGSLQKAMIEADQQAMNGAVE